MHDDPTRTMGQPEHPGGRPHGNMRLLVAGLIAVIAGLVVAILVIAGGDGGDDTVPTPSEAITAPSTTEETTTEPETTTETTEPTTTDETTAPEEGEEEAEGEEGEAEDGSGGLEVP